MGESESDIGGGWRGVTREGGLFQIINHILHRKIDVAVFSGSVYTRFSVTYIAIFLHPSFDVLFEMSQSKPMQIGAGGANKPTSSEGHASGL